MKFNRLIAQGEPQRRIQTQSLSDAYTCVAWLNFAREAAPSAYQTVLKFREKLEHLEDIFVSVMQKRTELKQALRHKPHPATALAAALELSTKEGAVISESEEQFRRLHSALNRFLARYAYTTAAEYDLRSGAWRLGTVPKHPLGPGIQMTDGEITVGVYETTAVTALARLATHRELYKVRLCEHCNNRWLVSDRQMDRFCSRECREASQKQSPNFKERKQRNQKKYRERERLKTTQGR